MWSVKTSGMIVLIIAIVGLEPGCETDSGETEWPFANTAEKPYLGAEPPGDDPVVFAPGIVSSSGFIEMGIAFSPDGREIYFGRSEGPEIGSDWSIWVSREESGRWSDPERAEFSLRRDVSPKMGPDGLVFYFYCQNAPDPEFREGTYVSRKSRDGWGKPEFFHEAYGTTAALSGNLYFSSEHREETSRDIVSFRRTPDGFTDASDLAGGVNTVGFDAHPSVAPDESFLLFDSHGSNELPHSYVHVSFRLSDGTWSRAHSLGEKINSTPSIIPEISPDGKYVFFHRDGDIWWVSSAMIDRLRDEVESPDS